jgi:hypothetical protein
MNDLNIEIGQRLRQVREIFHEGAKLSADQFAFLLDETGDRIRNYELGRATISVRLLHKLYSKGINPTYIITGEGDVFVNNEIGKSRRDAIKENYEKGKLETDNHIILVAAGRLSE